MGTTIGRKKKDMNTVFIPALAVFFISKFLIGAETQTSLILAGVLGGILWINKS